MCAVVITLVGTRLTATADVLADRTRLGEAVAGAVLLGAATSLSGIVLSFTAALNDRPDLAVSNALGGIAVQTVFLAVADAVYRRANLEHAAASAANMMQGALLVCLLAILFLGAFSPDWTFLRIHPVTPLLLATYVYGISHVQGARDHPMWRPEQTGETRVDHPAEENVDKNLARLWLTFCILGALMGFVGWVLERAASSITIQTGLTEMAVGVLFTSISTSLPELVTSIAAVRRGALTLAVGTVIGGNSFDTLFAAISDVGYRGGSIYHVLSDRLLFWIALTILMTGTLLMGLIRREERGIGRIGFESLVILMLYAGGIALVFLG